MTASRACRLRIRCAALAAVCAAASVLWGCSAAPPRDGPPAPAEAVVPEATWQLLGSELRLLSADAERAAYSHARAALERWLERVRARTDSAFIPWATGYWTHQWLALKLAWYRADDSIDEQTRLDRLTDYLYDDFRSRVLEPVAREIDPSQIMDEASASYSSTVAAGVEELRRRHDVPRRQFAAWLERLPAIAAPPGASLRDLVEARAVTGLPAYRALAADIRGEGAGLVGCAEALRPVAQRTAERLATTLAVRGGAAAASMLGGVPGVLVGLGIGAWDATTYEQERPALEAALRSELEDALRAAQWSLLSDRRRGVLAPVAHMAEHLGAALPGAWPPSVDESDASEALF